MSSSISQVAIPAQGSPSLPQSLASHSSGQRLNTSAIVTNILRDNYPAFHLTVAAASSSDLLGFAHDGHAAATPVDQDSRISKWSVKGAVRRPNFFLFGANESDDTAPPEKKGDGPELIEDLEYGAFKYEWQGHTFLLFVVEGVSGSICRPEVTNFILSEKPENCAGVNGESDEKAHALLRGVAGWMMQAGKSVLVFDGGQWKKDFNLWKVTQAAEWEKVVLKNEVRTSLRDDVEGFFESKELYESLVVPWKRGTIFHGPPGNGKTLVIQTLMKALSVRPDPIPTLYVKSFVAEMGPQWSISQIFSRARATAPCLLVFEDIDSMVAEKQRSYFLNEVDGLESNDGIYMLGTTNHLDRLDPALAQRPSRFDRKVRFDRPSKLERLMYTKHWKAKIPSIGEDGFPDELYEAIADATDGFSFAYLKELFVATLLGMARENVGLGDAQKAASSAAFQSDIGVSGDNKSTIDRTVLWPRIKTQIEVLRVAIATAGAPEDEKIAPGGSNTTLKD